MKSVLSVLAVLALLASPVAAQAAKKTPAATVAQGPSDVVRAFYAELTDVMKQGGTLGYAGRYKKLGPALQAAYDFPTMAHYAVGTVWTNASPQEQEQITRSFAEFSTANYASRFAAYDGEQFDVTGEKQTPAGTMVETSLKPKDGDPVALNYLMHKDDKGNWRIVDVYMAGAISELATRRAEFSAVIKRDGVAALVNTLNQKSKALGPS